MTNDQQFNHLLYNFESPETFLAYAEQCCGIEPSSAEFDLLKHVISTQEQLDKYLEKHYDGNPDNLFFTALQMLN